MRGDLSGCLFRCFIEEFHLKAGGYPGLSMLSRQRFLISVM